MGRKEGEIMVIGIIGGGASGMAAALTASQNPQVQVILLERQARVGRKLMATGNGRCNLSNTHCGLDRGYHGEHPEFVNSSLERFGSAETIAWFRDFGLYTVTEESGRIYPYSDQANSVVDVLRFALDKPNIRVITGCEVQKVKKENQGFSLETEQETVFCDRVIIACGGLAGTKLGGSMSGYKLLKSFGHRVTKLRPALVQLKSSWNQVASLKGIRTNCTASICFNGRQIIRSAGQLQFTEYGLSGPVIFEISRDVCREKGEWVCRLDFLPEITVCQLLEELRSRKSRSIPVQELLTGILHNRLGRVLVQMAGIPAECKTVELRDEQLEALAKLVKCLDVTITEPMGMDCAQVTAGGVCTEDFDPETMESKLIPGLFACGEVLDIDGDCGGYNLQWAWSSGRAAGAAAGEIEQK